MREFAKVSSVLVIIVVLISLAIAWVDDRPTVTTWVFRTVPVVFALAALALFLKLHFQRDIAPDYLRQKFGGYLDNNGFCFVFGLANVDGFCVLTTHFQNRFERPCTARVALRPTHQLFGGSDLDHIRLLVKCDGGAFGIHQKAIGIPAAMQGKRVKMEVGATVDYHEGRGQMLRFRDGMTIRADVEFCDTYTRGLTIAALFGGMLLISRPASVEFDIPIRVSEIIPEEIGPHTSILWRPGDAAI